MKIPLLNFEIKKILNLKEIVLLKKGHCLDGCKKYEIFFLLNGFLWRVLRVEFFN
jgi:hypothetical protein